MLPETKMVNYKFIHNAAGLLDVKTNNLFLLPSIKCSVCSLYKIFAINECSLNHSPAFSDHATTM